MGFEVFLGCYNEGEPAGIPIQRMLDAFGDFGRILEPGVWHVEYDSANWCDIYVESAPDDPNAICSAMVERPCADRRLWDAIFTVMRLGNVVLYWPGCRGALVASDAVVAHLSDEMLESLGGAVCVCSGKEILERIESD